MDKSSGSNIEETPPYIEQWHIMLKWNTGRVMNLCDLDWEQAEILDETVKVALREVERLEQRKWKRYKELETK